MVVAVIVSVVVATIVLVVVVVAVVVAAVVTTGGETTLACKSLIDAPELHVGAGPVSWMEVLPEVTEPMLEHVIAESPSPSLSRRFLTPGQPGEPGVAQLLNSCVLLT